MKTILITLILMLAGGNLCCQTTDNNRLTEQEYAIYLVIIGDRPKNFIVVDETGVDVMGEVSSGKLPEIVIRVLPETIKDYAFKNRKPPTIASDFPFQDGYTVINKEEREKRIPEYGRHYVVSRVGFSGDGKQAFVRFVDSCAPLCGFGAFYLLTNQNGAWGIAVESEFFRS